MLQRAASSASRRLTATGYQLSALSTLTRSSLPSPHLNILSSSTALHSPSLLSTTFANHNSNGHRTKPSLHKHASKACFSTTDNSGGSNGVRGESGESSVSSIDVNASDASDATNTAASTDSTSNEPTTLHSVTVHNVFPSDKTVTVDMVDKTFMDILRQQNELKPGSYPVLEKVLMDDDAVKVVVNKKGLATGMVKVNFASSEDRKEFYRAVHGLDSGNKTFLSIPQDVSEEIYVSASQDEFADSVVDAFYDHIDYVSRDDDENAPEEDWGDEMDARFDEFLEKHLEEHRRLARMQFGKDVLLPAPVDELTLPTGLGERNDLSDDDTYHPGDDYNHLNDVNDDLLARMDELTYNPEKFDRLKIQLCREYPHIAHFFSLVDELMESVNTPTSGKDEQKWLDYVKANQHPTAVEGDDDYISLDDLKSEFNGFSKENSKLDDKIKAEQDAYAEHDQNAPAGDFAELMVKVDQVQKVTKGGTIMQTRALMCVGNNKGAGGFGVGKGASPQEAMVIASRNARKNLIFVDRYQNSALMSDLVGMHNNCKVTLRALPPGTGSRSGPLVREILEMMGISDFTGKAYGNRNPYSVVRATYKALALHESIEQIARKRGKRVMTLARAKKLHVS